MYDVETIKEHLTNDAVVEILEKLDIPYKVDNGWIRVNCIFHDNADGFNLRWRSGSWYCFSA